MSQYKDKVQKQIKQKAFSYVDVIYGMTIIMIILGVIFGSIRMVERRLRENQLIILADSFANKIFDEVRLRKYDENIASILDNGLTKVFDVEEGEDQGDWSSFDDIDDFHGITATDPAFPRMETSINVNYVNFDPNSKNITLSNIPTLLKRVQLDVNHPLFDNPIRYSTIIGGSFDPDWLIIRAYPTRIMVDREPGIVNVVSAGDVINFTVDFSEIVYVVDDNLDFSLYLDIVSGVLSGEEGSYINSQTNPGEIKAHYTGGDETSQLTFTLDVTEDMNLAGSHLNDYISYRSELVKENGSIINGNGDEAIYNLPQPDSDNSFASTTNILPLLQQWNTPIFTTAEQEDFDNNLNQQVTTVSVQDIFDDWDRFQDNDIATESPFSGNYNQWTLVDDGEDSYIEMNVNVGQNLGFVSDESVENFIFEATLFSNHVNGNWKDNDLIGLIIAFKRENNKNYAIAVGKTFNGPQPKNEHGTFGVFYGEIINLFPWNDPIDINKHFLITPEIKYLGAKNYWLGKFVRVKVQRNGDDITVKMNGENTSRDEALETAYLEDHTISINLNDDLNLEKFKGAKQYGYIVKSQANTRWYDIRTSGGSVERRNISILVQLEEEGQTEIRQYYKKNDDSEYLDQQDVGSLQADIGYLRPLFNDETGKKFLLTSTGIIVYPF